MKSDSFKWVAGLSVAVCQSVSAVPITDTVIVGTQEWAQVDLFTNVTWDTLNTQCPAGVCSLASVVNGYDLAGWTWASIDVVQTLFNYFTGASTTAPGSFKELDSSWAPLFFSDFRPVLAFQNFELVQGWSSTSRTRIDGFLVGSAPSITNRLDIPTVLPDEAESLSFGLTDTRDRGLGAWVVRDAAPAPAPAPATLALFGLGLASLWVTRRKRGAKV